MAEDQPSTSLPQNFELVYPRPGTKVYIDLDPIGRSGHSMACDESNIYIFGGYNPQGRLLGMQTLAGRPTVLEELWRYNLATRKWTKMENIGLPSTCASSSLVLRGNNLYVYGGTAYPFGQIVSNSLKVCDVSNPESGLSGAGSGRAYKWNSVIETTEPQEETEVDNIPPRGYGQSIIFHGGYVFVFGGAVGFYTEAINSLHRLDLASMTWEKMEPGGDIPDGRYKQEIIKDNDCFYIVGGGRLHSAQPVDVLYSYTYATDSWTKHTLTPHPQEGAPKPRNAFGFVQVGRSVYISGGQCYGDQSPENLKDIWHLNMDVLPWQWRKVPVELPERLYFHRTVVTKSMRLCIYGGVMESTKRSQKLWSCCLPYQVANLSELCWFQVTSMYRNLKHADPSYLLENLGIPQRFIDRIQV